VGQIFLFCPLYLFIKRWFLKKRGAKRGRGEF